MKKNQDRENAILQGLKTYTGRPCKKCSNELRNVSDNGCIECNRSRARRIQAEKRADGSNKEVRQRYEQSPTGKAARKRYTTSKAAANSRWKYSILYKYGINEDQYNHLLLMQNYRCKICNKSLDDNGKKLAIDHCHTTGKVRSLLCHSCNVGLGNFNDNIDIMTRAIEYLMEHKCDS